MYRIKKRKKPLYAIIEEELLSKIERGTWPIGHQLPSEQELQEQYKVSRGTVRHALRELELGGYINRMSGRGTFVTRVTTLENETDEIRSFTQELSRAGLEPTSELLLAKIIQVKEATGSRVKEAFGIPDNAEVVHIKRLKKGNHVPLAIQSVYLLPSRCPDILNEELSDLFKLYQEKYKTRITRADETIKLSAASPEEASLLQAKNGTPLLIRERISYDQEGEPFEVLHSVDCADRLEYKYVIVGQRLNVFDGSESTNHA
ncbi:MAG: GntR family transcriptional regulator [Ardenticatenaceae bacterium]